MLGDFLLRHKEEILALTEKKTLELAGDHPSTTQLKRSSMQSRASLKSSDG